MRHIISMLSGAAIGLACAAATPASAQANEEIVVQGRYGTAPDRVRTLSQVVSYSDLDLSTPAGRSELSHRINLTARYLCDKLGESGLSSSGPVPSCRADATRDAMARVGTVEEHFAPRGTSWVAGPAWHAPYPAEWVTRYP